MELPRHSPIRINAGFISAAILISQTNAAVDHLFAFTGRALDQATGLQNNLNRWYDAQVGRWLSQDPIGFGGGDANVYRYCANHSVNSVDPTGLETKTITIFIDPTNLPNDFNMEENAGGVRRERYRCKDHYHCWEMPERRVGMAICDSLLGLEGKVVMVESSRMDCIPNSSWPSSGI